MPPPAALKGEDWILRHPSVWLVAPTVLLLLGQAVAPFVSGTSRLAGFLLIAPLLLCLLAKTRRLGVLLLIGAAAFALGFFRHKQLIYPDFPSNHLRVAMNRSATLYLEGFLRREPEKLPNRTRWIISAQRIWHPSGAEEIIGDLSVTVRSVRRDWRYGDRVRFKIAPVVPRDSGNPGGFNYARYLARRGVGASGGWDSYWFSRTGCAASGGRLAERRTD